MVSVCVGASHPGEDDSQMADEVLGPPTLKLRRASFAVVEQTLMYDLSSREMAVPSEAQPGEGWRSE
jgi:hypothetical protein